MHLHNLGHHAARLLEGPSGPKKDKRKDANSQTERKLQEAIKHIRKSEPDWKPAGAKVAPDKKKPPAGAKAAGAPAASGGSGN